MTEKRYVDQLYGFTIDIPTGWSINQNIEDMRLFICRENPQEMITSNLNMCVFENLNGGTIEQILRKTRIDVRRMVQDFKAIETKKIDDNLGSFMCKAIYQGKEYIYHQNIYLMEDEIYCFTSCYCCQDDKWVEDQLQYMLLSVDFS